MNPYLTAFLIVMFAIVLALLGGVIYVSTPYYQRKVEDEIRDRIENP